MEVSEFQFTGVYESFRQRDLSRSPLWIGIVGAAQAGKDTLARSIREEVPSRFHTPYLARPIKQIGQEYYGMSERDCHTAEGKSEDHDFLTHEDGTPMTNRKVLELIGDKLQELDPLVLLRYVQKEVDRFSEGGNLQGVFLPDLRTEPQARFIREQGGIVVYVQRDEAEEAAESADENEQHHTKTFYKHTDPDIRVENNGSLYSFKQTVKHLFLHQLSDLFPGIEKRPAA
jgi:hypothetical protein